MIFSFVFLSLSKHHQNHYSLTYDIIIRNFETNSNYSKPYARHYPRQPLTNKASNRGKIAVSQASPRSVTSKVNLPVSTSVGARSEPIIISIARDELSRRKRRPVTLTFPARRTRYAYEPGRGACAQLR